MKIQNNAFVAVQYTLSLDSGEVVDRSEPGDPLTFLAGAGHIIPGFEKNLEGMAVGDSKKFTLEPADGYGERSDDMLLEVPLNRFPDEVEIKAGMTFHGPGGRTFNVTAVKGEVVTVDANHPLAGERLHFDVKVETVREPTEEDMAAFTGGCGEGGCSGCGHHGESGGCC